MAARDPISLCAVVSGRVIERIERDYSGDDSRRARELIERLGAELAMWREISEGDRVERAALVFAGGDLDRLRSAVDLALRDWRDLLVAVGDA